MTNCLGTLVIKQVIKSENESYLWQKYTKHIFFYSEFVLFQHGTRTFNEQNLVNLLQVSSEVQVQALKF
ncbi:hypothetical protein BpHYR1_011604 [Brachionus plicatilis]|uniref:Uncharacterized protein n=1 Tax=Brachionus plicatilis TaxID=10195 RepID=A0A3M7S2K5_BRAPC|nr:hypothetical protein BpHYR1_011604 [Brachionus plicatilis]